MRLRLLRKTRSSRCRLRSHSPRSRWSRMLRLIKTLLMIMRPASENLKTKIDS